MRRRPANQTLPKLAMSMGPAAGMKRFRMATTSTISSAAGSIIRMVTIATITVRSTSSARRPEASERRVRQAGTVAL
ncbi:MAG TPA: hypothetical protein VJY15_04630 [Candidatus Acidoferrum sp.]|nr:hypothetical protein [Candidatus Acidoferrum sp.]